MTLQPAGHPVDDADGHAAVDGEVTLRPLDPRVRLLWWAGAAIAVVLVLIAAALAALAAPAGLRWVPPTVVVAVGVPLAVFVPVLRYRRWRYALRAHDLWIHHGVLWRTTSVIPFVRLQFVDTTQGPLDRIFGLAQLIVHTAAPGTSGRLPGLAVEQAEELRERLSRVRTTARDV